MIDLSYLTDDEFQELHTAINVTLTPSKHQDLFFKILLTMLISAIRAEGETRKRDAARAKE